MTDKETKELIDVYEAHYKYYKGWVFEYEHPGVFAYHQMGGPTTVYFTPDHDEPGVVSIQVSNDSGEELDTKSLPYSSPINPYDLFTVVRPYLEKYDSW